MQPKLSLLALALALAALPSLFAQTPAQNTPQPAENPVARLDSMRLQWEAALPSLATQTAERGDEYHTDKVFAHYFSEVSPDKMAVLRNELSSGGSRTENRFYLQAGKVFCWSLYREDKSDSPRARKRLTHYYCENGVVFHVSEKSVPAQESLDSQVFTTVSIADPKSMTEFMNRKFQHLLDAFQKVNSGN